MEFCGITHRKADRFTFLKGMYLMYRDNWSLISIQNNKHVDYRECVRNLDLRVQVHPEELWISKQRVHIVLEASKSAGAKGDVPKICGFVHPLHPL